MFTKFHSFILRENNGKDDPVEGKVMPEKSPKKIRNNKCDK